MFMGMGFSDIYKINPPIISTLLVFFDIGVRLLFGAVILFIATRGGRRLCGCASGRRAGGPPP